MRLATSLVPIALAFTIVLASPVQADSVIGIGIFGGIASPGGDMLDQTKESKSGRHYGVRIPMAFSKMFSIEPFLARTDGCSDSVYQFEFPPPVGDGFDVTAFGVNVGLGRLVNNNGFNIAPYAGVSSTMHWNLRGEYNKMNKIEGEPDGRRYINVSLGLTCVVAPR